MYTLRAVSIKAIAGHTVTKPSVPVKLLSAVEGLLASTACNSYYVEF